MRIKPTEKNIGTYYETYFICSSSDEDGIKRIAESLTDKKGNKSGVFVFDRDDFNATVKARLKKCYNVIFVLKQGIIEKAINTRDEFFQIYAFVNQQNKNALSCVASEEVHVDKSIVYPKEFSEFDGLHRLPIDLSFHKIDDMVVLLSKNLRNNISRKHKQKMAYLTSSAGFARFKILCKNDFRTTGGALFALLIATSILIYSITNASSADIILALTMLASTLAIPIIIFTTVRKIISSKMQLYPNFDAISAAEQMRKGIQKQMEEQNSIKKLDAETRTTLLLAQRRSTEAMRSKYIGYILVIIITALLAYSVYNAGEYQDHLLVAYLLAIPIYFLFRALNMFIKWLMVKKCISYIRFAGRYRTFSNIFNPIAIILTVVFYVYFFMTVTYI